MRITLADKKISDFPMVLIPAAGDTIPVLQSSANKQLTLGQLKSFINQPVVAVVSAADIVQNSNTTVVKISGICNLQPGSVEGAEITVFSTAPGKIIAVGLLPLDGFTYAAGANARFIWINATWLVLSQSGMTAGIL